MRLDYKSDRAEIQGKKFPLLSCYCVFFCIFVVKKLNHLYLKAKAKAEDF